MNLYLMFNWFRHILGKHASGNLLMHVMDATAKLETSYIVNQNFGILQTVAVCYMFMRIVFLHI